MEDLELTEFQARLSLAASMARRHVTESTRSQSLVFEAAEQAQNPASLTVQTMVATGITVVMLKQLEKPDDKLDIRDAIANVLDNTTIVQMMSDNGEHPEDADDEDKDAFRAMVSSMIEVMMSHTGLDELNPMDELSATLDAANTVAAEHEIPVELVFDDDALYAELIRTRQTIDEFTRRSLGALRKIDDGFRLKMLTSMAGPMVRLELESDADELELATETQDFIAEMSEDAEAMTELSAHMQLIRQASKVALLTDLQRFWGADALSDLSPDLREELLS